MEITKFHLSGFFFAIGFASWDVALWFRFVGNYGALAIPGVFGILLGFILHYVD